MRENTDQKKLRIWTLFTQCPLNHHGSRHTKVHLNSERVSKFSTKVPVLLKLHYERNETVISFSKSLKILSETVVRRCSVEKVLLEILQHLQEHTCPRVSFIIKLQGSGLWRRCFPVILRNF